MLNYKYIIISIFILFIAGCSSNVTFQEAIPIKLNISGLYTNNITNNVTEYNNITNNITTYLNNFQNLTLNGYIINITNGTGVNLSSLFTNFTASSNITSLLEGFGINIIQVSTGIYNISINNSIFQQRVNASCPSGSSIRAIGINGNVTCEIDSTGSNNYVNGVSYSNNVLTLTRSGLSSLNTTINLSPYIINDSNVSFENIYLADNIIHLGDTNTQIQFINDQINIVTGGSTRAVINNNGVQVVNGNLDLNSNNIFNINNITITGNITNGSVTKSIDEILSSNLPTTNLSSCPTGFGCAYDYADIVNLTLLNYSDIWLLGNNTYIVNNDDINLSVNTIIHGNGATIIYNSSVCSDGGGEIHLDEHELNFTLKDTYIYANGCGTYLIDGLDNDEDFTYLYNNVFIGWVQAVLYHRGLYSVVENNINLLGGKFISADYEGRGLTCKFNNNFYLGDKTLGGNEREAFDCNSHRFGNMLSYGNIVIYAGENYIECNVGICNIFGNQLTDDSTNQHSYMITADVNNDTFTDFRIFGNQFYNVSRNSTPISVYSHSGDYNIVSISGNSINSMGNTNSSQVGIKLDGQFQSFDVSNNFINGTYTGIEVSSSNGQILFNRFLNIGSGGNVSDSGSNNFRCDSDVCTDISGGGGGSSNFTGTTNGIRISNSGYDPYAFYVMRNSSITESVKVNVTDSTAVFTSIQDEPANKLGNYLFNANAFTIGSNSLPTNFTNVFGTGGLTRFCKDSGSQCFKFYGDASLNSLYTQNKPFDFGTEDNYNLNIQTNGTDAIIIDTNQLVNVTTRLTTRFYYEGDDYVCLGNMSGVC